MVAIARRLAAGAAAVLLGACAAGPQTMRYAAEREPGSARVARATDAGGAALPLPRRTHRAGQLRRRRRRGRAGAPRPGPLRRSRRARPGPGGAAAAPERHGRCRGPRARHRREPARGVRVRRAARVAVGMGGRRPAAALRGADRHRRRARRRGAGHRRQPAPRGAAGPRRQAARRLRRARAAAPDGHRTRSGPRPGLRCRHPRPRHQGVRRRRPAPRHRGPSWRRSWGVQLSHAPEPSRAGAST